MKNINILFLGGAKRNSLAEAFIKTGNEIGYKVNIFSYELEQNVPIAFIAKIILGKKWDDQNIYKHIKTTIKEYKINIILPFVDPAVSFLAKLKEAITNEVFIPISQYNLVDIFFNKLKSNNWCSENGINIPPQDSIYPMIAKPIRGSASKGIKIINNLKEYNSVRNDDYLIQRYIEGTEYTIDCYVSPTSKRIITIVPRIRLDVQGGESIKSITKKDKEIINFAEEILKKSGLVGPITIQILKEKVSGTIYFMEVNPRFGGAVLTSIAAKANIPLFLLRDYLNIKQKYFGDWDDNLLMIRRFTEYYINANNN